MDRGQGRISSVFLFLNFHKRDFNCSQSEGGVSTYLGSEIRFCGPARQTNHLNIQDHSKEAETFTWNPWKVVPIPHFYLSPILAPLHPCFRLISFCQNSQFKYPPQMLLSFKHWTPSTFLGSRWWIKGEITTGAYLSDSWHLLRFLWKTHSQGNIINLSTGWRGTMPPWGEYRPPDF